MSEKCRQCKDRLFKIINGQIVCRKGHLFGIYAGAMKPEEKTGAN